MQNTTRAGVVGLPTASALPQNSRTFSMPANYLMKDVFVPILLVFACKDALTVTTGAQRQRAHSSHENWRGGVQRLQRSVLEGAVSAMNGMISNLERTKVTPAQKEWDLADKDLQDSSADEALDSLRLNIKAKANVLRPVIVRLLCITHYPP